MRLAIPHCKLERMGDQEYKQRHREQGLCLNCSRPVHKGYKHCLIHLRTKVISQRKYELKQGEAYLQIQRDIKQYRRDNNLCPMCGAPLGDSKYINCQNCREHIHFRRYENADIIV